MYHNKDLKILITNFEEYNTIYKKKYENESANNENQALNLKNLATINYKISKILLKL